jgi:drug/metabolite transporter (DMT)-like permease
VVTSEPLARSGPALALGAAVLFGISAPAAKLLVGKVDPWLLAGLLYLGSGIGLGVYQLRRVFLRVAMPEARLSRRDLPWLAGAIVSGGVVGPVLLMFALATGSAAQSSLLLNLEGVFTAALAWLVFGEHYPSRVAVGMVAIAAGAMALSWAPSARVVFERPALLVAGACLGWAVDNNLTRKISGGDPVQIAALKGLGAGAINTLLAVGGGTRWPSGRMLLGAALVGLIGYGTSLVFFVLALRQLGAARTGAYFSTAPFIGALGSVIALGEPLTGTLALAALLMGIGLWLHLTERHEHEHLHEGFEHEHLHRHDEHHQHRHAPDLPVAEPHSHPHAHSRLRHAHPHYPDLHHRHRH